MVDTAPTPTPLEARISQCETSINAAVSAQDESKLNQIKAEIDQDIVSLTTEIDKLDGYITRATAASQDASYLEGEKQKVVSDRQKLDQLQDRIRIEKRKIGGVDEEEVRSFIESLINNPESVTLDLSNAEDKRYVGLILSNLLTRIEAAQTPAQPVAEATDKKVKEKKEWSHLSTMDRAARRIRWTASALGAKTKLNDWVHAKEAVNQRDAMRKWIKQLGEIEDMEVEPKDVSHLVQIILKKENSVKLSGVEMRILRAFGLFAVDKGFLSEVGVDAVLLNVKEPARPRYVAQAELLKESFDGEDLSDAERAEITAFFQNIASGLKAAFSAREVGGDSFATSPLAVEVLTKLGLAEADTSYKSLSERFNDVSEIDDQKMLKLGLDIITTANAKTLSELSVDQKSALTYLVLAIIETKPALVQLINNTAVYGALRGKSPEDRLAVVKTYADRVSASAPKTPDNKGVDPAVEMQQKKDAAIVKLKEALAAVPELPAGFTPSEQFLNLALSNLQMVLDKGIVGKVSFLTSTEDNRNRYFHNLLYAEKNSADDMQRVEIKRLLDQIR